MPSLSPAWNRLEKSFYKRVDKEGKVLGSKMVTINGETG